MNPTPLSKEPPSRLAWLFKAAERSSHRRPGDLLPIACQLVRLATDGLVMARGCTRIASSSRATTRTPTSTSPPWSIPAASSSSTTTGS